MIISAIVAMAENRAIGKDNKLLWHLPEDMAFFKKITEGHCVLMGRKNFESIPKKFRPLPNRTNLIITRNSNYKVEKCEVFSSIEKAIVYAKQNSEKELFIIGGGEIYKQSIHLVKRLYITTVLQSFEADTFFPDINLSQWNKTEHIKLTFSSKRKLQYFISQYDKVLK